MSRTPVPIQVVTVPLADLEQLIERAVAKVVGAKSAEDADLVTATKAARLVHRRTGDVLAALVAGDLRGKRRGRRWLVSPAAARTWAAKARS